MRDTDVYEDRIAALEAKIAAMESAAVNTDS